jgi:hypothetical protein
MRDLLPLTLRYKCQFIDSFLESYFLKVTFTLIQKYELVISFSQLQTRSFFVLYYKFSDSKAKKIVKIDIAVAVEPLMLK